MTFDDAGVCSVCREFDQVQAHTADYFGTEADLLAARDRARSRRRGRYDALHLLSGGKDSTYALYQLVELGFEVYALDARQRLHLRRREGQRAAGCRRSRRRPRVRHDRAHERDLPRQPRAVLQRVQRLLQDDLHARRQPGPRARDPDDRHRPVARAVLRDPAHERPVRHRPVRRRPLRPHGDRRGRARGTQGLPPHAATP